MNSENQQRSCWRPTLASATARPADEHGKLKHMEAKWLWLQQAMLPMHQKRLNIKKIPHSENRSDIFTKARNKNDLENHLAQMSPRRKAENADHGLKVEIDLTAVALLFLHVILFGSKKRTTTEKKRTQIGIQCPLGSAKQLQREVFVSPKGECYHTKSA